MAEDTKKWALVSYDIIPNIQTHGTLAFDVRIDKVRVSSNWRELDKIQRHFGGHNSHVVPVIDLDQGYDETSLLCPRCGEGFETIFSHDYQVNKKKVELVCNHCKLDSCGYGTTVDEALKQATKDLGYLTSANTYCPTCANDCQVSITTGYPSESDAFPEVSARLCCEICGVSTRTAGNDKMSAIDAGMRSLMDHHEKRD